jgi:hypothetical protein
LLVDSVTQLDGRARGRTVVSGSHAGRYAAAYAARFGIRAIVLNDAGVGLERAGISGLALLDDVGVAAAAVSHLSAHIGSAKDTYDRGVLSHVNGNAAVLGCFVGMCAANAVLALQHAALRPDVSVPTYESRYLLDATQPRVWALDSAALARPADAGAILATGSHGGLVGGRPAAALRADALGAVFNDAGSPEPNSAGTERLSVLDQRHIPAATVAAASARIGDGRSTYDDGKLSCVNEAAAAAGAALGMTTKEFVALIRGRINDRS